jgi:hypothetical protein
MEDFEGVEGLDICHAYGNEIVECEAQGGEWNINPAGQFCTIDGVSHTLLCGYADPGACDTCITTPMIRAATGLPRPRCFAGIEPQLDNSASDIVASAGTGLGSPANSASILSAFGGPVLLSSGALTE